MLDKKKVLILRDIIIIIFIALLNPFGINDALNRVSRDAIISASSHYFDYVLEPKSVSILINENYLRDNNISYPPPFSFYANLLNRLEEAEPVAIFIDISFLDKRDDLEAFKESLRKVAAKRPIYIASTIGEGLRESCEEWVISDLKNAASGLAPVARDIQTVEEISTYPLLYSDCFLRDSPASAQKNRPSAALMLFRDWCARSPDATCPPILDPRNAEKWEKVMIPLWSTYSHLSPIFPEVGEVCKTARPENWFVAGLRFVTDLGRGLGRTSLEEISGNRQRFLTCFSAQSVPLSLLKAPALSNSSSDALKFNLLVSGRVVFVGFAVHAAYDIVPSPTHGDVPGVLLHATAFENLAHFGEAYISAWPKLFGNTDASLLVEVTLGALAILLQWFFRFQPRILYFKNSNSLKSKFYLLIDRLIVFSAYIFIFGLFLFTVSICFYIFLRLDPMNWLAILAVTFVCTERQREALDLAFVSCVEATRRAYLGIPPSPPTSGD